MCICNVCVNFLQKMSCWSIARHMWSNAIMCVIGMIIMDSSFHEMDMFHGQKNELHESVFISENNARFKQQLQVHAC